MSPARDPFSPMSLRPLSHLFAPALGAVLLMSPLARAQTPPDHPPVGHPTNMNGGPAADGSAPDPNVPPGTVEIEVLDEQNRPALGAEVELVMNVQSIEEGNSQRSTKKPVPPDGKVVFGNLESGLRITYAVRVKSQGGTYDVPAFRLSNVGQKVTVHVFPTTSDINQAFVGFRGLAYVQMREDFFHISAMYRVMNMGRQTFVPNNVTISLPAGAQAVDVQEKAGDAGFEKIGDHKVRLVGTFPPGQRDLQFTFQLENQNEKELAFELGAPPHLAEQRILVEDIPGMELSVAGFGPAETTTGPDGKPVLFAQKIMQPGQAELSSMRIELSGLPTVGPGRWMALSLALLVALGGLIMAFLQKNKRSDEQLEQKKVAREVLLREMQLLESARAMDKIGPRTYEQTKREILLALARLEQPSAA